MESGVAIPTSTPTPPPSGASILEQSLRRAGPRKFLFGSDGPWLHPAVELAKVKALPLSPADMRLVLGHNFLRLISKARAPAESRHTPSPILRPAL